MSDFSDDDIPPAFLELRNAFRRMAETSERVAKAMEQINDDLAILREAKDQLNTVVEELEMEKAS